MNNIVFYEISSTCPSRLPDNLTEHERQLFDAINDAGAIDLKLLSKRNYGGQLLLSQSLGRLQRIGAIERRTLETIERRN